MFSQSHWTLVCVPFVRWKRSIVSKSSTGDETFFWSFVQKRNATQASADAGLMGVEVFDACGHQVCSALARLGKRDNLTKRIVNFFNFQENGKIKICMEKNVNNKKKNQVVVSATDGIWADPPDINILPDSNGSRRRSWTIRALFGKRPIFAHSKGD